MSLLIEKLLATKQTWKIVDVTNKDIVTFTTILQLDIKNDNSVSDYPVEKGSFASYNKTNAPVVINITAVVERALFSLQPTIDRLENLSKGTELLSIVTPIKEYRNFNLINCSYTHKRESGISSVIFELAFKEIMQTAAEYVDSKVIKSTSAKNSSSTTNEKTGQKQSVLFKGVDWFKGIFLNK